MDATAALGFLGASLELAAIDLLLGADNAILIAMACRPLPAALRPRALIYAVGGAILLRFALAAVAGLVLRVPLIKLVGGLILMAIAVELLAHAFQSEAERGAHAPENDKPYDGRFWRAVGSVLLADVVMSLDNVLALASIAQGNLPLLAVGIALGIPALAFGSYLVTHVLDRWPIVSIAGGALLGWVAGDMVITDAVWEPFARYLPPYSDYVGPAVGAILVLAWARFAPRRKAVTAPPRVIAPKAQRAIDALSTGGQRERRALIGAAAAIVVVGCVLLLVVSLRS